jgi:A/G-specific adenine glycosylase
VGTPLQHALLEWYERHGRTSLPWRVVRDPYYTLVSEFMLQQTQVDRVVPKFNAFIDRFPSLPALATASQADVLRLWQGLGYNTRAMRLHRVACAAVERFDGNLPHEREQLLSLSGVGPYTAAAIRAFAFDIDDAPIDTNIRRILHRLTAGLEHPPKANAAQLDAAARDLVPRGKSHDWNSAMMDLGATLCTARAPKCLICPLREHCAAAPIDPAALELARKKAAKKASAQNAIPFQQTTRYARGRIIDRLRALPAGERISLLDLHADLQPSLLGRTIGDVDALLNALERDGLIARSGESIALRE